MVRSSGHKDSDYCILTLLNYRYGVPGHKDSEFEALVAKAQGHDANSDGDEAPKLGINRPLLDKLTMVSPNLLEAAGVPVFKVPCVCVCVLARARIFFPLFRKEILNQTGK